MTEKGTWEKTELGYIRGRKVYLVRLVNFIDFYAVEKAPGGKLKFLTAPTGDLINDLDILRKEIDNV